MSTFSLTHDLPTFIGNASSVLNTVANVLLEADRSNPEAKRAIDEATALVIMLRDGCDPVLEECCKRPDQPVSQKPWEPDLTKLSNEDLFSLYQANATISGVMSGLLSQPRFCKTKGADYNAAGNVLEALLEEGADRLADAVRAEAMKRRAVDRYDDARLLFLRLVDVVDGSASPGYVLEETARIVGEMRRAG